MQCEIAVRPGQVARLRRAEVEDRPSRPCSSGSSRAELEGRDLQVVVDDVERRRVDPREVDLERPLRRVEQDALLLELVQLALRERLDSLDNVPRRGLSTALTGVPRSTASRRPSGEPGFRARQGKDLLPLVEEQLDGPLLARRADGRDRQDPVSLVGRIPDSFLGSLVSLRLTARPPGSSRQSGRGGKNGA